MKKKRLKEIILESYIEVLREQNDVLPTSTEVTLGEYDELRNVLVDLLGTKFKRFIGTIDQVSPKPTTFRVYLANGEFFYLKYLGKKFGFEAEIAGKKYDVGRGRELKQALDKLNELLRYNPMSKGEEEAEPGAEDLGFKEPAAGGSPEFGGETGAEIPEPETTTEPEFEEPGA